MLAGHVGSGTEDRTETGAPRARCRAAPLHPASTCFSCPSSACRAGSGQVSERKHLPPTLRMPRAAGDICHAGPVDRQGRPCEPLPPLRTSSQRLPLSRHPSVLAGSLPPRESGIHRAPPLSYPHCISQRVFPFPELHPSTLWCQAFYPVRQR